MRLSILALNVHIFSVYYGLFEYMPYWKAALCQAWHDTVDIAGALPFLTLLFSLAVFSFTFWIMSLFLEKSSMRERLIETTVGIFAFCIVILLRLACRPVLVKQLRTTTILSQTVSANYRLYCLPAYAAAINYLFDCFTC